MKPFWHMRKHKSLADITEAEVKRLHRLRHNELAPQGIVNRCSAVLRMLAGESLADAARACGTDDYVVSSWLDRFFVAGFRGWLIDVHSVYADRLETCLRKEAEVVHCVCNDTPPATHDYWSIEQVSKHLGISQEFVAYVFSRYDISFSDTVPMSERDKPAVGAGARHSLLEKLAGNRAGPGIATWAPAKQTAFMEAVANGQSITTAAALAGLSTHQVSTRLEQDPEFEIAVRKSQAGKIKLIEAALFKRALGYGFTETETGYSEKGERNIKRRKRQPPDVKACELVLTNMAAGSWSSKPKSEQAVQGAIIGIEDKTTSGLPALGGPSPTDAELLGIQEPEQ